MIVRPIPDALLCITQPEHARLAAAIMDAWRADGFPERASREATLLALACHDDGWHEEDEAPSLDADGTRLVDYLSVAPARREALWTGGVAGAARQSAYAAALVAQHFATLARATAAVDAAPGLADALDDLRDQWYTAPPVGAMDPPSGDRLFFLRDYAMLAMGDLLSLMACEGRPAEAERDGYVLRVVDTGRVSVMPDPFEGRALRFEVPARRLPPGACASVEQLRAAWRDAPVEPWPVTLAGVSFPDPS